MATIIASISALGALLPGLVCVGGMFVCMRMMGGGSRAKENSTTEVSSTQGQGAATEDANARIAALEAEVARLRDKERDPDELAR